jgi:hypothetical protein
MDKQRSTKHYTENVSSSNLHIDLFYDNNDISWKNTYSEVLKFAVHFLWIKYAADVCLLT